MYDDVKFAKNVTAKGYLQADNTTFSALISISSTETLLKHANAVDILVEKTYTSSEKLYLSHTTIVNGAITFKSGHGIVIMSEKSIMNGKVIGGKLIYV